MDDEQRRHLETLRRTHLQQIRVLEQQAAKFGIHVPAYIVTELEEHRQQVIELDRQLNITQVPHLPRIWNIPHPRNPNFTGRTELLTALRAALTSGQPASLTQAIYGLGGIGKTQLAVEYAYRHAADYALVWWIRTEEPTTRTADYARLAKPLNLPEQSTTEQALVVDAVRTWLEQQSSWLLIFDNTNEPADLQPYLPHSSSGHILITSRYPDWGELAIPLPVPVLPRDDAVAFLLNRTGQRDKQAAEQISGLVDALPLALAQAGSYIAETGCTLADYVQLFRTHQAALLAQGRLTAYTATVTTTWDLAFRQVYQQAPAATDLLAFCTFLAPDDIPLDLLRKTDRQLPEPLATVVKNPLALNQAVAALRHYSLVERQGDTISVHRLIQATIQDQLDSEQRQGWAALAVQIVKDTFQYENVDFHTWAECEQLLPHALKATEHGEQLQVVPTDTACLLNEVGLYLDRRAEFGAAKALLEQALVIGEAALGPDHPHVATYLNNLGWVLRDFGDLDAAKTHFERALAIDEVATEPNNAIATCLTSLGMMLLDLGDLDAAKTHLERALAIDEAALHIVTTNSGYPLDQNLYQAVKGMSAAARIVRPGGAIIAAAECCDGLPDHGNFKQLLQMRSTPHDLLELIESPGFELYDQWEAQTQAIVQRKAEVYLYSSLAPQTVRDAMLTPIAGVEAALAALLDRYGPDARVAVLPEGPQTVPYVLEAIA